MRVVRIEGFGMSVQSLTQAQDKTQQCHLEADPDIMAVGPVPGVTHSVLEQSAEQSATCGRQKI